MKICTHAQTQDKTPYDSCTVTEYALGHRNLDLAIAKINGRYPLEKWALNEISAELGYILEGNGKVVTEKGEQLLSKGDAVIIEAGEKYYWEGKMDVLLTCHPIWSPNQHQVIDA